MLKLRKTQQRELLKYANTLLEHINANTLKRSWDEPCEPALEQVTADQWKMHAKLVAVNFVKYHLTKFKLHT